MYIHEPIHISNYGTTVNIYTVVKERKDMSLFLTVLKKVYKMSDADRYAAFGEANVGRIIEKIEYDYEFIDKYYQWEKKNMTDEYGDYRDLTDEEAKDILEWLIHDEFYDKRNTNKGKAIIRGILALNNQIEISKIMKDVLNIPDRKK